ncbi:MAG: hypothetical protein Q4D79_12935 [Propionibacteriaceae bacterium]|nr:hypothetical protein [Propionibacteriaceae bacterium]
MKDLRSIRPNAANVDAELTPQRRAAIVNEIVAARTTPALRTTRWLAAAGVAAAVITAAALTVPSLLNSPSQPSTDPVPTNEATTEPPPNTQQAPAHSVTVSLVNYGSGTVVSPQALQQVAATVEGSDTPAGLVEGKFLHVVEVSQQDAEGTRVLDAYIDADRWMWRHDTLELGADGSKQEDWYLFDDTFMGDELDSLPRDPEALEAVFRSGDGSSSEDERVFAAVDEILISDMATPELRAACIRVLQRVAENPQEPALNKDGELATPNLEVAELALPDGSVGYRVTFTDPGARPGVTRSLVLNATGQVLETNHTYDGSDPDFPEPSKYTSQVQVREYVDSLPDDFVAELGTEHVVKDQ